MTPKASSTQPAASLDDRRLPRGDVVQSDLEITPRQVKQMLDERTPFVFIDCRRPEERQVTRIDGTTLLPLDELPRRLGELRGKENDRIVVHCRSGSRSLQFTRYLRQQGFTDVHSMAGGILRWNEDIRPGPQD